MSKSKLTLLIDGNWLLMSRLLVISNKFIDDTDLCNHLQLLMTQSIKRVIKQFPEIDNIILCADGGSWRTSLEIPNYLVDENGQKIVYKGNREKSLDINWDKIFQSYEEYLSLFTQNNIQTYKVHSIEGDDLIYWTSQKLNSLGTNCIIWSKDNDLKQLVNVDQNKCFTVWWNQDNGMFISDFDDDNLDFLFNFYFNQNDQILQKISNKYPLHKINKNSIILDKIIRGDKGDNIEPICYRKSLSKKFRISTKDIDFNLDWKDDKMVYNYLKDLFNNKKYKGKMSNTLEEVFDHFKYNRTLVVLNKEIYPSNVTNILETLDIQPITNKDISVIENKLQTNINQLNGFIEFI